MDMMFVEGFSSERCRSRNEEEGQPDHVLHERRTADG